MSSRCVRIPSASCVLAIIFMTASPCLAASKMTISPSNRKQLSNSTLQFTATVNGEMVAGPTKWTSSNTAVATIVGTTGIANAALLSAGTTTITAVHGGQTAQPTLTVTVAVAPVFTVQRTNTNVSAVINSSARVQVVGCQPKAMATA